jgi:hypothetical protein
MKSDEIINDCGIVTDNYCQIKCPHRKNCLKPDTTTKKDEVQAAQKWIEQRCWERRTINWNRSSYGLKHDMERETKTYVSNGSFIKAAVYLGYRVRPDYPNGFFNMGIKTERNKRYWVTAEKRQRRGYYNES